MKYFLIGLVMLVFAYLYAHFLVKLGCFVAKEDTEEAKENLCNTRTRLEHVLEEEGEKIEAYKVEAQICKGKIVCLNISTDRLETTVEKDGNITDYSMRKIGFSKNGAIAFITVFAFIVELFFFVLMVM